MPLIARARLTIATNITTYFRNRPPRAGGDLTGPASGLAAIRFICSSVEMGLIPDSSEPVSPPFGEKSSISIGACAQAPPCQTSYQPAAVEEVQQDRQNATECCFVLARVG